MKTLSYRGVALGRLVDRGLTLAFLCAAFSVFLPAELRADGVVAECSESSLRAAMQGGGLVTFACDGVIDLSSTITVGRNTTLDGVGRTVTVSGAGAARVFQVNRRVAFAVLNLAIADGRSTNGAALYNDGGTVRLTNVTLSNNRAQGLAGGLGEAGWAGLGGAIYSSGTLSLDRCRFLDNAAEGGPGGDAGVQSEALGGGAGGFGLGGVLYNTGEATIAGCSFERNWVVGGRGGAGSDGPPSSNVRVGGKDGGFGGDGLGGAGGAIYHELGLLSIWDSTFADNRATGGNGGRGGNGSSGPIGKGGDAGDGGFGGLGVGGAIYAASGRANVTNCTLAYNQARGGNGAPGGAGAPCKSGRAGGGWGGHGGAGGEASGGGLFVDLAEANLFFSTASANGAWGGAGGLGGNGAKGCFSELNGVNGTNGVAGAALGGSAAVADQTTGSLFLRGSILNASASSSNCFGAILDGGNNLSSDDSARFTENGSLEKTDPRLGPLANYGGSTLTFALLADSPALDAGGDRSCPETDQRGVDRPVGASCDIGSFERAAEPSVTLTASGGIRLLFVVTPLAPYEVQVSTDLIRWEPIGSARAGGDGRLEFDTDHARSASRRFFRAVRTAF